MSFFESKKLFLDLNYKIFDTPRRLSLNGIVLDRFVAETCNLSKVSIVFVKNRDLQVVPEKTNAYIQRLFSTPGQEIILENATSYLTNHVKDKSNFEVNKVLKYSNIPSDLLIFENNFSSNDFLFEEDQSTDTSRIVYNLDFISSDDRRSIWNSIRGYYILSSRDRNEEFKFFLAAYDSNNNLIDSTSIQYLKGYTVDTTIKVEYDELVSLYKTEVLAPSVRMRINDNNDGFVIDNFIGDRISNYTQFDLNRYDIRGRAPNHVRFLVKYPNLNSSWIKFAMDEDNQDTAWIFGGSNNKVHSTRLGQDNNFTEDGILDGSELERFNIRRDVTKNIVLVYKPKNIINEEVNIDIPNNNTWRNFYNFFDQTTSTDLAAALIRDYKTNDSFEFDISVPYQIISYDKTSAWDRFFTVTVTKTLEKSDKMDLLLSSLLKRRFKKEIDEYLDFNVSLIPQERPSKDLVSLNISIKDEANIGNLTFFNAKRADQPYLSDILQVVDNSNPDSITKVSTLEDSKKLFRDRNLTRFINLSTNSYLRDLVNIPDTEWIFEIKHTQISNLEIQGELAFVIKAIYMGEEIEINYFVDIPAALTILNNQNNGSYINELLPDSGLTRISFNNNYTQQNNNSSLFVNFDIVFDKQKSDSLSQKLLFGNIANEANVNDLNTPAFFEKLLLEIDEVRHCFDIFYPDKLDTINITKAPSQLKNFKLGRSKYVSSGEFYKIENVIKANNNDLKITPRDVDNLTNIGLGRVNHNLQSEVKKILKLFLSNDIQGLIETIQLKSIKYYIKVKFRQFIFPQGLNIDYQNTEGPTESVTYENIGTFNNEITGQKKISLYNLLYERNPEASNHKDLTMKWLSRNFLDDFNSRNSQYHRNSSLVKDYYLGGPTIGYINASSESTAVGLSSEYLSDKRAYINNEVKKLERNYSYDLLLNDNLEGEANILISSNIVNNISRDSRQILMDFKPKDGPDNGKVYFDLKINTKHIWEPKLIKNVEVVFIPSIINKNIRRQLKEIERTDQISNVSLRNAINIGNYRNKEGNINFKPKYIRNCDYYIDNDNKNLRVEIDTNPTSGSIFRLSTYLNRCGADNSGIVFHNSFYTTERLMEISKDKVNIEPRSPQSIQKTFIVREFIYRIKVTFEDGKVYYRNFVVPKTYEDNSVNVLINRDPMRIFAALSYKTAIEGTISNATKALIALGFYEESFYNLAFMPYKKIRKHHTSQEITTQYNSVKIRSLPGYQIR